MNKLEEFLQTLTLQGIHLWPQDGKLRCAGPPHRITPDVLSQLKEHRTELLQRLREPTYVPASYGQQGLWALHQSAPDSASYHVSVAFRIHSALDVELLRDIIQLLINRHASLRTCFIWKDDTLMQQIAGYTAAAIEMIKANDWSEADLLEQVRAFHERPFDLSAGPLLRAAILHHSAQSYSLLLSVHHIVVDGWSIYQLIDELFILYAALRRGLVAELPIIQHTYADYVAWQQALLQTDSVRLWSYWQEQLRGELPVLQLPTDKPRPPQQTFRGISQPLHLSPTLTAQLKQVARQNGCTLYIVLLAAYQILLHRYSGQEEILVGLPMAGRSRPEFAEIIGYFASPVVARADLRENSTFMHLLAQMKEQVFGALDHQDYPFVRLVEQLNPKRDPSRAPIAQAAFALQKPHRAQELLLQSNRHEISGLTIEPILITLFEGQDDIELELTETASGLSGHLKGNADLFTNATLARMVGHFLVLLEGIVTGNPLGVNQPIAELPLLTKNERDQLLVAWNDTALNDSKDKCIHALFEAQVECTPDALALVFEGQQLTYAELNARANQVAHHLQSLGVGVPLGAETLVGLCVERSIEMVVGLLGILKAGGTYVPLDPSYPPERLAFMLQDAQVALVLTQQKFPPQLVESLVPTVCLDSDWPAIAQACPENLDQSVAPSHLAYVIYTSGSTGQPKGVMVEHQALAGHITTVGQEYQITRQDRVLQFASFSFDAAQEQLFVALTQGAALILRGNELWSSGEFAQQVSRHRITVADLPPAYFQQLLTAWVAEQPSFLAGQLRLILVGGEKIQPEILRLWQQLATPTRLLNAYGPTEATITTTLFDLTHYQPHPLPANLPIGRPLPGRSVYILDHHLQPVPVGIFGELYIGGAGLARGYWANPELAAERFIINPFRSTAAANKLYKTGDLCRWLPDGNIEYAGRTDFQVKLRGFRIELGEIEAYLKQDLALKDAVVVLDEETKASLHAYVVFNNELTVHEKKYKIYSHAQNLQLQHQMEDIHLEVWPRFFEGDAASARYWRQLYKTFPAYQIAITDGHKVIAVCNTIPLYWDGLPHSLPDGWDAALLKGFTDWEQKLQPNTLCILAGSVSKYYQGQAMSYELIKIIKSITYMTEDFEYLIVPVRPSHKHLFPAMTLEDHCAQRRVDGLSIDPWLRVHERLQGRILGYCHQSQHIEGTVEQWESWTGQTLTQSGEYLFEGCMQPVQIDVAQDRGIYYDLAVWITHRPESYLTFNPARLTPETLHKRIKNFLPSYMVPSTITVLDALPLTPNGKVDRKALPASETRRAVADTYVPPRTATETALATIWQEVLHVERVGIHENFFELGGNSISSMRVVARAEQVGLSIALRYLFQHQTIAQLATAVTKDQIESAATGQEHDIQPLSLQPMPRDRLFPLSFVQQDWLLRSQTATGGGQAAHNMIMLLQLTGKLDAAALGQSLDALIQRHEILRTTYPVVTGTAVQSLVAALPVNVIHVDLSSLTEAAQHLAIEQLIRNEEQSLLNLVDGPLLRATLLYLSPQSHLLLMTVHHIYVDGGSDSILIHELATVYRSLVAGAPISLPPLPIQYADFAWWQRQLFTPARLATLQAYWKKLLATPPPPLCLPTDRPRTTMPAYPADVEFFELPSELIAGLKRFSQTYGSTLAISSLAAYATLLARYSGSEDMIVGMTLSKRQHLWLEPLVGCFMGIALLRLSLTGAPSFVTLLEHVQQVALTAMEYQELTLRQLVQATSPDWLPGPPPGFRALFNFLPEVSTAIQLPDLVLKPIFSPPSHIVADVNLILYPLEHEGTESTLQGALLYRKDLFERETIKQMILDFQTILTAMVVDPTQTLYATHFDRTISI